MQRNGVVILASVALAAVAIIVAAYFVTHKPEAEPKPVDLYKQAHAAEIACLEGGGSWVAGKNADGQPSLSGYCEHSEPTAAPVVASPSPVAPAAPPSMDDCSGNISFNDCSAAVNVAEQVYKNTGYLLPMSIREIVSASHTVCRVLGDAGSTDAELLGLARGTAITLGISRQLGLAVVSQIYINFC
jgi:hypothetical protein